MVEEAKELRAILADIEISNALAKSISTKERDRLQSTVAKKLAIALDAELIEVRNAQKQTVDAAEQFDERATDAVALLAKSLLHI